MSKKDEEVKEKTGSSSVMFIGGFCALSMQAMSTIRTFVHNKTAGIDNAITFAAIDLAVFACYYIAHHPIASKSDKKILSWLGGVLVVFCIITMAKAQIGINQQSNIDLTKKTASSLQASADRLRSDAQSYRAKEKYWSQQAKDEPRLETSHSNKAAGWAAKALDAETKANNLMLSAQSGVEKTGNTLTALFKKMGSFGDYFETFYSFLFGSILIITPSIIGFYTFKFMPKPRVIYDLSKPKKKITTTLEPAKLEASNEGGGEIKEKEGKNTTQKNAPKKAEVVSIKKPSRAQVIFEKMIERRVKGDPCGLSQTDIRTAYGCGESIAKKVQGLLMEAGEIKPLSFRADGSPAKYEYIQKDKRVG